MGYRLLSAVLIAIGLTTTCHAAAPKPWTFDSALAAWEVAPLDPYLQYVLVQIARKEGRVDDISSRFGWRLNGAAARRRASSLDLVGFFSGGVAVQESLQLDALGLPDNGDGNAPFIPPQPPPLLENPPPAPMVAPKPNLQPVAVNQLKGPTVQSHPWEKMLAGRKPAIDPLAMCVPEDFWFAQFRSPSRMLGMMEHAGRIGNHLFTQVLGDATTKGSAQRIRHQLGLNDELGLRPLYDRLVEEIAITGSDLYLQYGSDVTVLMKAKTPGGLKAPLRVLFDKLAQDHPTARRDNGRIAGHDYLGLVSADRSISVYIANPTPDLHIRSNSKVALERVLLAIEGKQVKRLGEALEFAYMRTLMPRGSELEDGFIYLSDPFIRRMVGAEVRLAHRRRLIAENHLRMIGHACLLYRTQFGIAPKNLMELSTKQCAPGVFGQGKLTCPQGGSYQLASDALGGISSIYNHREFLTPLIELPLKEVSAAEAADYTAFVTDYSQYWRTYFDPIALRVQSNDDTLRLETIILPLIDNTIYTDLARSIGGKVIALDTLPISARNVASIGFKLNKDGWKELVAANENPGANVLRDSPRIRVLAMNQMKQIGLAMHNYESAFAHFPSIAPKEDPRNSGKLSWRVHLLPYLEQEALYKQFKLDEAWDSEHNKKLIAKMPAVYISPRVDVKISDAGKTVYMVPVHANGIFSLDGKPSPIQSITDGTSNTIMILEAKAEAAVIWTKPDDLVIDPKQPLRGLIEQGDTLIGLADGSVQSIPSSIDPMVFLAAITKNGGEVVQFPENSGDNRNTTPIIRWIRDLMQDAPSGSDELEYGKFLVHGLGDQILFNLHDDHRVFDFEWRNFDWNQGGFTFLAPVVHFLTCPVSVAVPVRDSAIVDRFLKQLDDLIAKESKSNNPLQAFGSNDFYTYRGPGGHTIRVLSISLSGLRWRLYWGRIGNGFYITNRPNVLTELAAAQSQPVKRANPPLEGHIFLRVRPQNWNAVLPGYEMTWFESARNASKPNQIRLSNVLRAFPTMMEGSSPVTEAELEQVYRIYGERPICPEGGTYRRSGDGITIESSFLERKADVIESATGRYLKSCNDINAVLTFTDDGLRAVFTIKK